MFCIHSWKKNEEQSIRTYIDYSGIRVGLFPCVCEKCEKRKVKKFH